MAMTWRVRAARLLKLAKLVRDDGIVLADGKKLGFNMGTYGSEPVTFKDKRKAKDCGAVACIAGTAAIASLPQAERRLQGGRFFIPGRTRLVAGKWLGLLDFWKQEPLFLPQIGTDGLKQGYRKLGLVGRDGWITIESISHEISARVLERMAEHKSIEPDWVGVINDMVEENRNG